METLTCRFCGEKLSHSFVDIGMSPLSNSYLSQEELFKKEEFFPLRVYVCEHCFLVQLPEVQSPEKIFRNYAYFSSYSDSWLSHARNYVEYMIKRFDYTENHQIIELASNDGYLLQYFKQHGIPVLGIEPAKNVAMAADAKQIPTIKEFFTKELAAELIEQGIQADLLIGNNVLAQVPNLNDFVAGMKTILKPEGVITIEFPHLLQLMNQNQFDTIYHEHYSYFSFITAEQIFDAHGLKIFDVEELPTHGGSLRIFAKHAEDNSKQITEHVLQMEKKEVDAGLTKLSTYQSFGKKVEKAKWNLLEFLIKAKHGGKSIVGYGAPAKGNTLLNYTGVRSDFLEYTVDRSPVKQNHFLPGTHIPIFHPDKIKETKPDYVLILPWNIKDEIMKQISYIRKWGGKFVVPIPQLKIYA